MMRRLSKMRADERGSIIVELALVAPVLAMMIVGVVDMSNAYSRKLALEQGAQRALEKIMQTTDDTKVEDTLASEAVCQVNGMTNGVCNSSPITTNNVSVTYSLDCTSTSGTVTTQSANTKQDSNAAGTYNAFVCPVTGTASKAGYISITINDKYTPMFPLHFSSINSDGTYHMSATAGMRQS